MIFAGCARARPPAGGDGGPGQALGSVRPGHGTEPDSEAITIELIEARVSATSSSRNSFGISGGLQGPIIQLSDNRRLQT